MTDTEANTAQADDMQQDKDKEQEQEEEEDKDKEEVESSNEENKEESLDGLDSKNKNKNNDKQQESYFNIGTEDATTMGADMESISAEEKTALPEFLGHVFGFGSNAVVKSNKDQMEEHDNTKEDDKKGSPTSMTTGNEVTAPSGQKDPIK